jgi:CHAT domain-containing protein
MDDKVVVFVLRNDQDIDGSTVIIKNYDRFKISDIITELLTKYKNYRESENSTKYEVKALWEDFLEEILKELHDKLFLNIQPRLNGIKKIVMIPYSDLHFVPLHAMFSVKDGLKRYIIDDYVVTYAPSAQILKNCLERPRKRQGKIVLAHANPIFGNNQLKYSMGEINAIKELFKESDIIDNATKFDLIKSGPSANIFHYAGHAHRKALLLHSDNDLNMMEEFWLEDIFESLWLPKADLVTLSACETGMILPKGVDEHFGISSGLTFAGAATVISSLWAVSDISTSLMMRKLYELINNGMGKGDALRQAQLWLKDPENKLEHIKMLQEFGNIRNKYDHGRGFSVASSDWHEPCPDDFDSPYYWAGFICTGAM